MNIFSLVCYKICIVRPSGGVGLNTYIHNLPPGEHYQDPRYHNVLNVYLLWINKKKVITFTMLHMFRTY